MEKKLYKKPQVLSYEEFPEDEVLRESLVNTTGDGSTPDVPIIHGVDPPEGGAAKPFSLWDDEDEDEDEDKEK